MGRNLAVVLVALVVMCSVGATSAGAHRSTQYYCTATLHKGAYAFGAIFSGSSSSTLHQGCRLFATGGFSLQWGIHHPSGWVIVAEYINPTLNMTAAMISPSAISDVIFRVMNKPVFTSRGWIFVKRG